LDKQRPYSSVPQILAEIVVYLSGSALTSVTSCIPESFSSYLFRDEYGGQMIEHYENQFCGREFASSTASGLALASPGRIANSEMQLPSASARPSDEQTSRAHKHLTIGCLVFPGQDQIDFTGPFEVLSRIPDSTVLVIAKTQAPIRDVKGLILTPQMTIAEAPPLDLLLVSGGLGQQALMEDEEILSLIRNQSNSGRYVFSICTGALLCGAAGILRGRRATTHWAAWDLLHYYGAIPVKSRVVVDGNYISTAGITAGLDGSLKIAAMLRNDEVAQEIQLDIEYAPDPPFHSGSPDTALPEVVRAFFAQYGRVKESREAEARHFAAKLGIGWNHSVPVDFGEGEHA
jgi:cyclohexyl-isocyanide hydratase